jgi:hypothetical protein
MNLLPGIVSFGTEGFGASWKWEVTVWRTGCAGTTEQSYSEYRALGCLESSSPSDAGDKVEARAAFGIAN